LPARLVLSGGFTVDDGCHRALDQQATRLGFADLRACLQALLDDGWSIPQLATHLHTTQPVIRRASTDHPHPQPSGRQQLARQRQRAAPLSSAPATAWPSWASTGCGPTWWTGWPPRHGRCGRSRVSLALPCHSAAAAGPAPGPAGGADPAQRTAAAAARGPVKQARAVQQRRHARLTKLGFATLEQYLQDRYLTRGWPRRLCVELGVGYVWLDQQLTQLGLRP
jgi:hypothetical protein